MVGLIVGHILGARFFLPFASLSCKNHVLILFVSYLVRHSGYDIATGDGVTHLPYVNAESLENASHVCKLPCLSLVLLFFHLLVGASRPLYLLVN